MKGEALSYQPIQIAVATDDGYAGHLSVMLLSLFERGGQNPLHVHALVPTDFKSSSKIAASLGSNARQVTFHPVDAETVAGLKQRPDITNATYYRLLMAELLPPTIGRIIYLDCDMLVCGDISPLWEMPLGDAIVAAVPDPGFTQRSVLGLSWSEPYFNAGMLLVDLDRWRRADVGKAALDFAASEPERLSFNDQCALNWVLRGRWLELPSIWNLQAFMLGDLKRGYFSYPRHLRKNTEGARIVHFNDPGRPWLYLDEHPFKPDYLAYRARTPWARDPLSGRYPHNIILKALRRNAPFLLPAYMQLRKHM
jgi:lipopolysaccharide biosynthesis glycosyltransferase